MVLADGLEATTEVTLYPRIKETVAGANPEWAAYGNGDMEVPMRRTTYMRLSIKGGGINSGDTEGFASVVAVIEYV